MKKITLSELPRTLIDGQYYRVLEDDYALIKDGLILYYQYKNMLDGSISIDHEFPIGVYSNGFLLSDADDNQLLDEAVGFSFLCLQQFYENLTLQDIYDNFTAGNFKVLDISHDDSIKHNFQALEKESLEEMRVRIADKTPLGYTAFYSYFHRSGSTLIFDKTNNTYLIFGQDEGSYFGCELPSKATTIDEAFKLLMPEAAIGKKFTRQGEWFFVEAAEPKLEDIRFTASGNRYNNNLPQTKVYVTINGKKKEWSLDMPRPVVSGFADTYPELDSDDSAKHFMQYDKFYLLKNGDMLFLNPLMKHERGEHKDVKLTGLFSLHKNRAVQSYSQEGVD